MDVNLIPKPQSLEVHADIFVLNESTGSQVDERFQKELVYFQSLTGLSLNGEHNTVSFKHQEGLGDEEFFLQISSDSLQIAASTPEGIMRGIQTLRQLIPVEGELSFQALSMHDFPRFEWRGMLLDCSRHFMEKDFVKRYIDLLAYHKMNVLHWHLTEDQGWR
ncbi:MAG: family 20 glycosylhydrolase, partial [Bacteroidetes bacterium]|nr:family 20 glycosylhydrolase [Bacteroidota bacterium]